MSKTLDQFQNQRDVVLRDEAGKLPSGDRDTLLAQAILQRYSQDSPRELVTDVVGNGTSLIATPSSGGDTFDPDFSVVKRIEFPTGGVPPSILQDDDWQLYRDPSAVKIMLINTTPSASQSVRVTWTTRHKSDGSTIPDVDFEAVCDCAAALCYEALAGIYAQTGDSTISADVVNYRSKSQEYLGLSKTLWKRYFNHLGIDPTDTGTQIGPAIATGNLHENMGWGGDRLTHPRSNR